MSLPVNIVTLVSGHGLRQTSDRKAALKNDGHLGYTDTLKILPK